MNFMNNCKKLRVWSCFVQKILKAPVFDFFKLISIIIYSNFDQEWDFQMVQIGYKQFSSQLSVHQDKKKQLILLEQFWF